MFICPCQLGFGRLSTPRPPSLLFLALSAHVLMGVCPSLVTGLFLTLFVLALGLLTR